MKSSLKDRFISNGKLLPCPPTPNCVCSEGHQENSPIKPLVFTSSASEAWQTLQDILLEMGGQIEEVDSSFLHATFRSRVFRFVDDVTARLDKEKNRIQIRSASRVGRSDFGVNRKRMEELRKRFTSPAG